MQRTLALILLGFIHLATAGATSMAVAQQARSPQQFAQEVASSNNFEIEAAKLTIERGKDPDAIQYARDLLREHEQISKNLTDAVKDEGLTVSAELNEEHRNKLEALRTASEADFDQAYLSTQITSHESAVAMLKSFADSNHDGALKTFAENALGTMRMHAIRAQDLTTR